MQVLIRTDRLLVKQMDTPDVTSGGIILPTQAKVKQAWATVLLMGPEVEGIETHDRIAFADFSGVNVELTDDEGVKKEYLILSQDDVLLVLRDEEQGLNDQELDKMDDEVIAKLQKEIDNRVNSSETKVGTEQGREEDSEVHSKVESSGSDV